LAPTAGAARFYLIFVVMRVAKKGGKLLGEGAYGCVFSPSLCSGDPAKVTKVFQTDVEADAEMEQGQALIALDPEQKYFLYPTEGERCDIREDQLDNENKCKLFQTLGGTSEFNPFQEQSSKRAWTPSPLQLAKKPRVQKFPAVEMRKGEDELGVYVKTLKTKLTRGQLLEMCMNIFEGVKLLQTHGKMHFDIKPQNIMVVKDGDAKFSTRLIDFGKLRDLNAGTSLMDNKTAEDYPFLPPECRLRYGVYKGDDEADIIAHERSLITQYNLGMFSRLSKAWEIGLKGAIENITVEPEKIDVYGIGMALFIVAKDLEKERKANVDAYDALVLDCIHPDPSQRITIDALIQSAKGILAKTGGAVLRKTTEKVAIGKQMRVVYKGRHGKMYVRVKGAFVTLAEARKGFKA
jgi:serine/threonine protein kinase